MEAIVRLISAYFATAIAYKNMQTGIFYSLHVYN